MNPRGRVIVTCGPAYSPIDEVRRITNHSTGRLGNLLSSRLTRAGWEVVCFRGEGATDCAPTDPLAPAVAFSTNDDLLERWRALPEKAEVAAVFHAAALTDFTVQRVTGPDGIRLDERKIPSRTGAVTLTLEPAKKLIGELRALFPAARLVGWKYELSGTRDDVFSKGLRQIAENRTDACVVNGRAYGEGFGVIEPGKPPAHLDGREDLCDWLLRWLNPDGQP